MNGESLLTSRTSFPEVIAGIDKDLVTIGNNRTIEVWSKEFWDAELDPETGELISASEAAEGLEIYGF